MGQTKITFTQSKIIPPGEIAAFGFMYLYTLEQTNFPPRPYAIGIRISDFLNNKWGIFNNLDNAEAQLKQYAVQEISERFKKGYLMPEESILYLGANMPDQCPFTADNVPTEFIID